MKVFTPRSRRTAAAAVVLVVAGTLVAVQWLRAQSRAEIERLQEVLEVRAGMRLAEIGAGAGTFTVAMAREVGPDGHIWSTELDANRLRQIREAVAAAGLDNVTVLEAAVDSSNLPEACCDAIFMRDVYHHFTAAAPILASIVRALRPGGRLAIIDFPPRTRHGITPEDLKAQVTAAGFEVVLEEDDWPGRNYLVLFRKLETE
jgi:ubiquinone/menaquinone biosynthesis C-methylase UbiE